MEHIRELRNRVIKIALAVIVGMAIGWFVYPHVWHFVQAPYCRAHFATHAPGQAAPASSWLPRRCDSTRSCRRTTSSSTGSTGL